MDRPGFRTYEPVVVGRFAQREEPNIRRPDPSAAQPVRRKSARIQKPCSRAPYASGVSGRPRCRSP